MVGDMRGEVPEVVVVRAWVQPAAEQVLRVRVVRLSPGQAERPVLATTSVEEAFIALRDWLLKLERQARPSPPVMIR